MQLTHQSHKNSSHWKSPLRFNEDIMTMWYRSARDVWVLQLQREMMIDYDRCIERTNKGGVND